jgi:hypothetical protein
MAAPITGRVPAVRHRQWSGSPGARSRYGRMSSPVAARRNGRNRIVLSFHIQNRRGYL